MFVCLGDYGDIFPTLRQDGVTLELLDLFLRENRIDNRPSISSLLLNAIMDYPNSHRLIFGVNTNMKPAPILVNKSLLVLIASSLPGYTISSVVVDGVAIYDEIYTYQGIVLNEDGTSTSKLKLNKDF